MEECNLHTIVRLPNSVFKPYASIGTNLLFFEKGEPTKETWFYEQRIPEGQNAYSMTKPIKLEQRKPCADCQTWPDTVRPVARDCKKKHDALVEITLPPDANIFASAYQLYLPSKEDLRQRLLEWTRSDAETGNDPADAS